jgi:hypothetical protein
MQRLITSTTLLRLFLLIPLMALTAPMPAAAMPETTVQGIVWKDANCDGIRQTGEAAILNQDVWLFAAGSDGTINTADDQVVEYGNSGMTGQFFFTVGITGLPYALVILPIARPVELMPGPLHAGSDVARDNDLRADLWATNGFQMNASQTVTGIDIGLCRNPNITLVYLPAVLR